MEHKSLALADVQFKLQADDRTFTGYASAFNRVDSYGDTIVKGAYAETLQKNGLPKMFFNHRSFDVPIGKWLKAEEDDYGLLLTGEFTPGNRQGEEVRAALKHGTLDSLSIGFSLTKGDYDEATGGRVIRKVDRLRETSIVTFPADKFASIDMASVKSFDDDLEAVKTIRDFEYFLRDVGSFSKGAAQALTARAKVVFGTRDATPDDDGEKMAQILKRLEQLGT
ncbi:HK97 family phage prohead protease [Oxalicibacterium faecigallinarum]|uniref:Peptidase U35 n=1 Tax=Oxalicibacterium faecigallinarum TaxID=573741 RepID=A0A8J3F0K9_9BURK|nr:HK97 family phage prohead protease [Oxalicibacterium faecigallinarum]GGI16432.1 peptidase U35 [Oxalicibacterium faecigallinarum]